MFLIKSDKTICITRGDAASFAVTANSREDSTPYTFKPSDVVRFQVYAKGDCGCVVLRKEIIPTEEVNSVTVSLTKADTAIGEIISAPADYWYEIELNPDTKPHTIIGYDELGPKIFRLFPEGGDVT